MAHNILYLSAFPFLKPIPTGTVSLDSRRKGSEIQFKHKEYQQDAVFRDSSYTTDAAKINFEQIFKALSPHTELKTL